MDYPRSDPSGELARRFNAANLRVQIRQVEHALEELNEFGRIWGTFVKGIGEIIKLCHEEGLSLWDDQLDDVLRKMEAIRLDLNSRQHIATPDYRDPLAKFVRTGVREYSDDLWSLIGESARGSGGTLLVPTDADGEPVYRVDVRRFEINADEAQAEIARRRRVLEDDIRRLKIMLEESERATAEARQRHIANLEETSLTRLAWAKLRKSKVGKIVWWLGAEPLRKVVLAVLVLGGSLVIPSIRHAVAGVIHWLVSRF